MRLDVIAAITVVLLAGAVLAGILTVGQAFIVAAGAAMGYLEGLALDQIIAKEYA